MLTQITAWWLRQLERDIAHHMIIRRCRRDRRARSGARAVTTRDSPAARCCAGAPTSFPVECVVRGYISGSAWKEYSRTERSPASRCRPGCARATRLDRPIFSPATKAETGHDENITIARNARELIGAEQAAELERADADAYTTRARHRRRRAGSSSPTPSSSSVPGTVERVDHRVLYYRRGADAGQLALLARRSIRARPLAAELRQAAAARLSRRRARARAAGTANVRHRRFRLKSSTATSARYLEAFRAYTGTARHRMTRMNFAREGLPFIVIAVGARRRRVRRRARSAIVAAVAARARVLTVLALWVAYFFRDPERTGERGAQLVIAPADGKLVLITEVDEPTFIRAARSRCRSS